MNLRDFAAWNWRKRGRSASVMDGGGFLRKREASCIACKHIVAACVMQIKQEQNADGTTTVTKTVMFAAEEKIT